MDALKKQRALEMARIRDKRYRAKHVERSKELRRLRVKKWRALNPEKTKEHNKVSNLQRKKSLKWRLGYTLRNRLRIAIINGQKVGSAICDLGCSILELKRYLESKFQPGMTWENWSHSGWHIDHIKPLAAFDLNVREQWLSACHYSNLQPLWAKDNLKKGVK